MTLQTRVWTEAGFAADDPWRMMEEGEAISDFTIVPLTVFLALDHSQRKNVRAVRLDPADKASALRPYLGQLAMVAVNFPVFNDGRAFSHASLLRDRHGYEGEIRAVGDILIDQVAFMHRCGIDSFAVSNPTAIRRLTEGRLGEVPNYYQPASRDAAPAASYSWRRKASPPDHPVSS
jgi:uncharacterized protein (DUF934 family)